MSDSIKRARAESHWDSIYEATSPDSLRWFEPVPSTLRLVLAHSRPADAVIDVGGGTSRLASSLLDRGYDDITVLDLSETALTRARLELDGRARSVEWMHADVTRFAPTRQWHLWHDRAVYHFLIDRVDRAAYRRAAAAAIEPGGVMVVSTFALSGPDTCAGLPVLRYDQLGLASEFADHFVLVDGASLHTAPDAGDQRPYVAVVLERRS
jgi:2-polyprenyl-3-methyl-5-hydroxy-6-metoxy-1,4-benzoquinol methylase